MTYPSDNDYDSPHPTDLQDLDRRFFALARPESDDPDSQSHQGETCDEDDFPPKINWS